MIDVRTLRKFNEDESFVVLSGAWEVRSLNPSSDPLQGIKFKVEARIVGERIYCTLDDSSGREVVSVYLAPGDGLFVQRGDKVMHENKQVPEAMDHSSLLAYAKSIVFDLWACISQADPQNAFQSSLWISVEEWYDEERDRESERRDAKDAETTENYLRR